MGPFDSVLWQAAQDGGNGGFHGWILDSVIGGFESQRDCCLIYLQLFEVWLVCA